MNKLTVNIINSVGDIDVIMEFSNHIEAECFSRHTFAYTHPSLGHNMLFRPKNYVNYAIYTSNTDNTYYIVHPSYNLASNATFVTSIGNPDFKTGFNISAYDQTNNPLWNNSAMQWQYKNNNGDWVDSPSVNIPLSSRTAGKFIVDGNNMHPKCIPDGLINELIGGQGIVAHQGIDRIRLPIALQWVSKMKLDRATLLTAGVDITNRQPLHLKKSWAEWDDTLSEIFTDLLVGSTTEGACVSLAGPQQYNGSNNCILNKDGKPGSQYCADPDHTADYIPCDKINDVTFMLQQAALPQGGSGHDFYPYTIRNQYGEDNKAACINHATQSYADQGACPIPHGVLKSFNTKITGSGFNQWKSIDYGVNMAPPMDHTLSMGPGPQTAWLTSNIHKDLLIKDTPCKIALSADGKTYKGQNVYNTGCYMDAVSQLTKAGKKVIIDLHSNNAHLCAITGGDKGGNDVPLTPSQFYTLWYLITVLMIRRNPDSHKNIEFEIFNEPNDSPGCKLANLSKSSNYIASSDPAPPAAAPDKIQEYYNKYYTIWAIDAIRQAEADLQVDRTHLIYATTYNNYSGVHKWGSQANGGDGSLEVLASNLKGQTNVVIAGHQYCDKDYSGTGNGCDKTSFSKENQTKWLKDTDNILEKNGLKWFMTEGNIVCNGSKTDKCNSTGDANDDLWHNWLTSLNKTTTNTGFTLWNVNVFANDGANPSLIGIGSGGTSNITEATKASMDVYMNTMPNLKYGANGAYNLNQFKSASLSSTPSCGQRVVLPNNSGCDSLIPSIASCDNYIQQVGTNYSICVGTGQERCEAGPSCTLPNNT